MENYIFLGFFTISFIYPIKHKEKLYYWFTGVLLLLGLSGFIVEAFEISKFFTIIIYYILAMSSVLLLTKLGWKELIYCSLWIVVTYKLSLGLLEISAKAILQHLYIDNYICLLFKILYMIILSVISGITLGRTIPRDHEYKIGPRQFISSISLVVIFEILNNSPTDYRAILFLGQLYCITVLYLQNALFTRSAIKTELDKINYLWHHSKNQYKLSKENINLINRKCHNLKHQIAAIKNFSTRDEQNQYIQAIEDSINIYDSIVKTGNEALDTILTEKSLYCQSMDIKISCVADGEKMNFISPVDIYTIFGNAIDNAIESVIKIDNPDYRFIDVLIYRNRNMLVINIINPFSEPIKTVDDLPRSTKPDNGYHGFGLKSIKHTVVKYGGHTTINTESDNFTLSIIIPLTL